MLTVHHLGISQSERVIWLCEELGLNYELKGYKRDPQTQMAPAEYKALHPMGISPLITDNEVSLPESGAILEYIATKYNGEHLIAGKEAPNYSEYLFWFHFANGTLAPSSLFEMVDVDSDARASSAVITGFCDRCQRAYNLIENRLGESKYLAGDELTLADIMTVFCLTTLLAFTGRDLKESPNTQRYLELIVSRPAYQVAVKKANPENF